MKDQPEASQPDSKQQEHSSTKANLAESSKDSVKQSSKKPPFRRNRLMWVLILVVVVVAIAVFIIYRSSGKQQMKAPVQPVSASEVAVKDMPLWINAIGTATPRNLVTVKTRVDGELFRVYFTEGQMVKKGQLLAEIDPRPLQTTLTQANGQLARDSALLKNAQLDLQRYRDLWAKDSIAKQTLDTQEALVRQYEGTVENDRGVVQSAKLQLSYTRITAPVSGRIGLRLSDPGNQIKTTDTTGLATIAQIEPMTVVFSVPEVSLPEITRRMATGEALKVEAWDRDQKNRLATGKLLTVDNQIDTTTGTVKLKAVFDNADHSLFPSQFLNIRLLLGIQKGATVVPTAAILKGTQGSYVYTVDAEGTVKYVAVTPGAMDGDLTAVGGALQPGASVVIDGADKLRDGGKAEVIPAEKRQAAPSDTNRQKGKASSEKAGNTAKNENAG